MSFFEKTSLPQKDPSKDLRRKEMEPFRQIFDLECAVVDNVPLSKNVPEEAKPGTGWSLKIVETAYKLRRNWEKIQEAHGYVFEKVLPQKTIKEIAKLLSDKNLVKILEYSNPDLGVALTNKRPVNFDEYFSLFKHFKAPEGSHRYDDDQEFADYFSGGLNPVMFEVMTQLPQKLSLTDDHLKSNPRFQNETISTMIDEKRLFIIDYEILQALEPGQHPDQDKYVYCPIVVLGVPRASKNLEAIAIQYGQDASIYPVVTPQSGRWDWLAAKTMVKVADANFHEVSSHLGLTHLVIEPIVVATYRNLSKRHPLHELLMPHFEGTIPINALAVRKLINPGGTVEQLLTPKIESAYRVLEVVRNTFDFQDSFLPKTFKKRGVDTDSTIKEYPYRDDALLIWDAIRLWAQDYIRIYYRNDQDVIDDYELQSWAEEIESPEMGRINGFRSETGLRSRDELVDIMTMIIYTASAQHAAMNFPQGKAAAVPFQPLAGYAPAPTELGLNEKDVLNFLPPRDRAIKQTHTLTLLGATYYTQLGQYDVGTFSSKKVIPKLARFQSRLKTIELTIRLRNKSRRTPYPYLIPSSIPQSINI